MLVRLSAWLIILVSSIIAFMGFIFPKIFSMDSDFMFLIFPIAVFLMFAWYHFLYTKIIVLIERIKNEQ